MKKFITIGLLVAAVLGGAARVRAADEAAAPAEAEKTEKGISIAEGFMELGRETGVYRFFNPQTAEEKHDAYVAALEKTVDAEIAAGHFHGAWEQIHKAHGVDQKRLDRLAQEVEDAEAEGYHAPASLPQGAGQFIMIIVGLVLIFLAIKKGFEPLLLLPIGFGAILTNIPMAGIAAGPMPGQPGGFLYYFYTVGVESGVFPLLIFMGVGAMTDFGPLLANPKTALLGAAAQFGIFIALLGAMWLGGAFGMFTLQDSAAIGIIGGADGPTAIFLASRLSPNLLGAIAVAAYSYMALVPIIQPPIMRLLTTPEERAIEMKQLRHVTKTEKIVFPLLVLILCLLLLPSATPLIGMLMLGNLMKECKVVDRLSDTAQNSLINIVTIMLGLAVGSKLAAEKFLNVQTLGVLALGLIAFCIGTAAGVLLAKLMNKLSKEQINPLIGSAGVSAVPMAARVSNKVGLEANPQNFLLMHAMGPNVAGVIGSAVAAGVLLALCG
ncbi:sodium ion-translocating decarboxylase subunit beta [Pontiella sp. NLcol2]|uniref:Sodium ion-translocating decarboxylase subunit beta n=1 Tax=Pontiella agarivorans TaxID=3038953 RepID=A0ABU5MSQ2_9BACT|nr:sodium ion-translocating decarboxylase subunit beta [Pontiella agarivorans]MDZ8117157.1 sodium ion-translocating decarboxylase subunit beta [Pontiella agarivorans]